MKKWQKTWEQYPWQLRLFPFTFGICVETWMVPWPTSVMLLLSCWFYFRKQCDCVGRWNHPWWKTILRLSCIVAVDDLVTQGARPSVSELLVLGTQWLGTTLEWGRVTNISFLFVIEIRIRNLWPRSNCNRYKIADVCSRGMSKSFVILTNKKISIWIFFIKVVVTTATPVASMYDNFGIMRTMVSMSTPSGWGWLRLLHPFLYFPIFLKWSKHWLPFEYHVHIWQVSPQLSCGDTCQIWISLSKIQ